MVGLGAEIAWARPTRPGDTLRVESEILEIKPSRSKPNQGVVTVRSITFNQNGEQVQVLTTKILAFKRDERNLKRELKVDAATLLSSTDFSLWVSIKSWMK